MERTGLIGVDTNVLLRLVLDDDKEQTDRAEAWLLARSVRDPGYISLVVLCELAWVLARTYRHPRERIAQALSLIMSQPSIQVERGDVARRAMEHYASSTADFGDCCIAAIAEYEGCEHTVTFDKTAARLPGMRLLR